MGCTGWRDHTLGTVTTTRAPAVLTKMMLIIMMAMTKRFKSLCDLNIVNVGDNVADFPAVLF